MQQEYGGEAEGGLTEETAFELGCGEEDFARIFRFGEQVQKAQASTLRPGEAASVMTRG